MILFTHFIQSAALDNIFFKDKSTGNKILIEENTEASSRNIRINLSFTERQVQVERGPGVGCHGLGGGSIGVFMYLFSQEKNIFLMKDNENE